MSDVTQIAENCRVLIDGYNLIFELGLQGKSVTSLTLERSRDRLLVGLAQRFSEAERSKVVVVFDAARLPIREDGTVSQKNGFWCFFAVDYEDADSMIEALLLKHSATKTLVVVSSDHRIQTAASRRRAQAVDSEVWWDELRVLDEESDATEKDVSDELRGIDWAKEFED